MGNKAKILEKLYYAGKVTISGLDKALADGTITQLEYDAILNINNYIVEE